MQLTGDQIRKIADISSAIAQICAASIFIPFFLDTRNPRIALVGFVLACVAWFGSVYLVKKASRL